jgi:SAM-dependent methyltransferase
LDSGKTAKGNSEERSADSPFESLAEKYDAWFDDKGKLIFEIEVSCLKELLSGLPRPWVEIGVGSGRFAEALGIDTGLEPSEKLGRMASLRGIQVKSGRGEDHVFPEASFGTAFIIVTLCFVDDPLMVLSRTSEMLVDGGRLVLGLVAAESPWARFYVSQGETGHPFYRVARFYEYEEVLGLIRGAGFEHERTLSCLFQKPGMVESMESPRDGFFRDAGFIAMVCEKEID